MEGCDGANQNPHRMASLSADVITIDVENGRLRTEGSVRYVWWHLLARTITWASGTRDAPKRTSFVKTPSDQYSITFSSTVTRKTGHELGHGAMAFSYPDGTWCFTGFGTHAGSPYCMLVFSAGGFTGVVLLWRRNAQLTNHTRSFAADPSIPSSRALCWQRAFSWVPASDKFALFCNSSGRRPGCGLGFG